MTIQVLTVSPDKVSQNKWYGCFPKVSGKQLKGPVMKTMLLSNMIMPIGCERGMRVTNYLHGLECIVRRD